MLINGTDSNETLFGTVDDNEINGLAGNDFIFDKGLFRRGGTATSDAGRGFEDDDLLLGGLGNDTLVAGVGNDTLEGGLGADDFVPNIFDNNGRTDTFTATILDFNPEEGDRLDVSEISIVNDLPGRDPQLSFNNYGISDFETIEALTEFDDDGIKITTYFNGDENITAFSGISELNEEDVILSEVEENDVIREGFTRNDYFGGLGDDIIIESPGVPSSRPPIDDRHFGEQGNDTFYIGYGSDYIYGGSGIDTAYFIGNESDYEITSTQPGIINVNSAPYTNTLYDIENIGFISPDNLSDLYYEEISTEEIQIEIIPLETTDEVDTQTLLTSDELADIEGKEAQSSAQPTEDDDTLIGTDSDDFVVGSVGNDFGQGLAGNDEYFWENKPENLGGSFVIEDSEGDLDIVNIDGEDPSQTVITRDGDDIVLSLSGGSTVILTDQFSDPQFEQVRFDFETVFTQQDLIDRIET